MNKIDELFKRDAGDQACIENTYVIARPENNKKCNTSLWYRLKEAWNVVNGKAETLYYYKQ